MTSALTFDYVVVGGGTSGCVLAARLSQNPRIRVLLLEAGQADKHPAMASPAAWFALQGSAVDWADETAPQRHLDGAVLSWPRGKTLGGSSAINGMMHLRGDRSGYDAWGDAGADGWTYDSLLPFFKRSEQVAGADPAYRGTDGPMRITPAAVTDEFWSACFTAAEQAGHSRNEDNNAATAEGVAWGDNNVVDGVRQTAADAYLTPALGRANLTVAANAGVQRLIIENGTCRGVEFLHDGQLNIARAEAEVILTAGTVGTPHLLMLSGLGPAKHLRAFGIDVVADLPGVGANLQDHPKSYVSYTAGHPVQVSQYSAKPIVLMRSDPGAAPDLQAIFIQFPLYPRFVPGQENGYSIIVSLMTPASRGTVRLSGPHPAHPPIIDPNYLAEAADRDRMLAGLRRAREIGAARALGRWRDKELFPGLETSTDSDLLAHARRTVTSYFHPVGTCRIGSDLMSVVDPELRVHGIANLRIADASVMPTIVSANTNAPTLAIAERAAAIIANEPGALA